MRAALLAIFGLVLSASLAHAAPLSPAVQQSLAGEWRANPEKPNGACGADAGNGDILMVIEFALTGGTISLDDGTEGGGEYAIASGMADKSHITLKTTEDTAFTFARLSGGLLKADASAESIGGMTFKRCRPPADRSAIKLTKAQLADVAHDFLPKRYVFIDTRAKKGCKATDYQYVFFNLVGPLAFEAGRWNSYHVGELLADGKKPKLPLDDIANFTIGKADYANGAYRFTLTELIPPNNARGDTTTITLKLAKDGTATIPEWKRTYKRCAESELAAQ
ncbi:MAG: hypothetical protein GC166_03850 [Alphaproteobacteria bacterium]|nr:hypothetical protein [Alphaproteobacteria bacterium]